MSVGLKPIDVCSPCFLFQFTQISSKEQITFVPENITNGTEDRYYEFQFIEGLPINLTAQTPTTEFVYEGQYWLKIFQQGEDNCLNFNPDLSQGLVWEGRAQVEDDCPDELFDVYESPNEDNANIIYLSDDEFCASPTPTASITPTITPTSTITPTITPTNTPTPSITSTITPSVTPTNTPTPSITSTITPSVTPTITPTTTSTPTTTPTLTPSITPSVSPSLTPSLTPTNTSSPTPTPTPSSVSGFNIGSGFDINTTAIISDGGTGYFVLSPNFYNGVYRNKLFHLNQFAQLQNDYLIGEFNQILPLQYVGMMEDNSDVVIFANAVYNPTGRGFLNKFGSNGNPVSSFSGTTANDTVANVRKLSGGDYIVSGNFTSIGGGASTRLARITSDCIRNATFATNVGTGPAPTGGQPALYIFADDTILVGGTFTTWNGTSPARLIKFNSDATRVTAFNNNVVGKFTAGGINTLDYDTTGDTIYAGGTFTYVTGATTYTRIVALNGDGSLKTSFSAGTGFNSTVRTIKYDPVTNRLYCLGQFTSYNGTTIYGFCRLTTTGALDTTYLTTIGDGFRFNNIANGTFIATGFQMMIEPNGDVLIVGDFTNFDNNPSGPGTNFNRIIKLDKDGNVITTI